MLVFILVTSILRANALINPAGPTIINDFTNCLNGLVEYNFNYSGFLIFANTKNVSTAVASIRTKLIRKISDKLKFTIQIKSPTNQLPVCVHVGGDDKRLNVIHIDAFEAMHIADYFIVIVDNYNDFSNAVSRIIRSRSWNPNAKFIILLFHFTKTDEENEIFVEHIFTCLFHHNAINVVVIVPQATNIRNSLIYSWRPYDPPKYCGYFNETAKNRLLLENSCAEGVVTQQKDIFKNRVPNDMHGCTLEIIALERQPFVSSDIYGPNIERLFINQLADLYNFRPEYKILKTYRGERDEVTGVWDGALNFLSAKEGHILLGGIFPDYDVHQDFECSNTYLADSYTWVAPRAQESPKWLSLFVIYKRLVWYCTMGGFLICVSGWYVLGNLSKESAYNRSFGHCMMNTWISHLGFCAYCRPRKQSLRVFYVFFNIYCILFLTGYQTKLIDVLTNPSFEEQIDTIEELVESDLKYGGFEELHDLFLNSSDPFDYFLGENWVDVYNITQALIDVAVHRNFSVLCSRLELAHMSSVMPELSDSAGNYKYFAFEINMFTVPMEMISLRGFPFMKDFSLILERFKQLGVNSGVRRYFKHLNLRRRAKLLRILTAEQSDMNPLTMQHLQGGFLALALGSLTGTITLIIEIVINSQNARQKFVLLKKILRVS